MPRYSHESISKLRTVHPLLQRLMIEIIIDGYDHKIMWGERDETTQNAFYEKGWSQKTYPNSKHNRKPTESWVYAVDAVPYPVQWPDRINRPNEFAKDLARFYYFAGYVRAKARTLDIPIRQGTDWNGNFEINDQTFDDAPHIELVRSKVSEGMDRYSLLTLGEHWRKYKTETGHIIDI